MSKSSNISVRPYEAGDEEQFRARWEKYNVFYKRTIPENVTAKQIERMLDPKVELYGAVAVDSSKGKGQEVVGFVTWLPHIYTGTIEDIVYLHDLYVDEDTRNGGVGRKLIEYVYHDCKKKGIPKVYWHTQEFNHRAQLLYTKVASKTPFVQYAHAVDGGSDEV